MRIKKSSVENLSIPEISEKGKNVQKKFYDDQLKGFGVRVTSGGTKSFFVEKRINRRLTRITLGRYPELTAEMARKKALEYLGQIAIGVDPHAEKRTRRMAKMTLNEVLSDYLLARKSLKEKTRYDYQRVIKIGFSKWINKPIITITKEHVAIQHKKLGIKRGEAYANLAMRVLRALFNFAAAQYEDSKGISLFPENPVKRLSQTRAWYRVERRKNHIKSHELSKWYLAVIGLENQVIADYLLFVLFTGLRRQEAATLKWTDVDLSQKSISIKQTKNHEVHTLPLSDFLYNLLLKRQNKKNNDYVFPGSGKAGHIVEPRKQMAFVIRETGIQFTVHDLRRTYITIAESLDIPAYALKRLMNHKMNNDITGSYIIVDVERLRKPMQLITDYLLKSMNLIPTAKVINLEPHTLEKVN